VSSSLTGLKRDDAALDDDEESRDDVEGVLGVEADEETEPNNEVDEWENVEERWYLNCCATRRSVMAETRKKEHQ
jgi:hypothetical protein